MTTAASKVQKHMERDEVLLRALRLGLAEAAGAAEEAGAAVP
jgi:hypothetical protein